MNLAFRTNPEKKDIQRIRWTLILLFLMNLSIIPFFASYVNAAITAKTAYQNIYLELRLGKKNYIVGEYFVIEAFATNKGASDFNYASSIRNR
jgi:hypothetical protein